MSKLTVVTFYFLLQNSECHVSNQSYNTMLHNYNTLYSGDRYVIHQNDVALSCHGNIYIAANTGHSPYDVSTLGQRRRRWANIGTALSACPVFAGITLA